VNREVDFNTKEQSRKVTVIGLGSMGSALARAFMDSGYQTTVWNRSEEKCREFVAQGAIPAATVKDAILASPITFICLLDYKTTRQILESWHESLIGSTIVNLASGTPEQARELSAWIALHQGDYLDGAIMATPSMIGQHETLLFYAGSEMAFNRYKTTLHTLGGKTSFVGSDPGLAKLKELAVGSTLVPALWGFLEGAALIKKSGGTAASLVPYAEQWIRDVILPELQVMAQEIDNESYNIGQPNLQVYKSGIEHHIHVGRSEGVNVESLHLIHSFIEQRITAGHGNESFSSLIELIK
jgi:3-hydroxyisobutyrate dehydrogenase-like beta-hydroxyacid dehydrogenase